MKKLYLLPPILFLIYWSCDDENSMSECDSSEVELWGECYSKENTTLLSLENKKLTSSIPPEIGNLTNLTTLSLINNQLTGSIPSEIGNLTNLKELYLYNNQLTGSIPPEIWNLTNLEVLRLYNNQLTGSIPPEIGNLTNLDHLDLSFNELTGTIPESICDLHFYKYTSVLTNNQLCPLYPPCVENYLGEQDTTNCGPYPIPVELYPITFQDGTLIVSWSQNNDNDFSSYKLNESTSEDMSSETLIYETDEITDTSFVVTSFEENQLKYYQIVVENSWGFQSVSDIEIGSSKNWFVKTFGGSSSDYGSSVQQTSDGGYIITGYKSSLGNGGRDVWLIKTDSNGNEEWNQTFGGSSGDEGYSVQQTTDGGYIITGYTRSFSNGIDDVWLIKTASNGNEEWNQTFGGSYSDEGYSVQQTTDGGYIITGHTKSVINDTLSNNIWLIKTDSNGDSLWTKTFGGSYNDEGYSVQQTTDGGYIITGSIYGSDNIDNVYIDSVWLIKTDSNGNEQWNQIFSLFLGSLTTQDDSYGRSVQQTTDGGYIITGSIYVSDNIDNVWLIKTDSQGIIEWEHMFGGSSTDKGYSVQQTSDGGYIITGVTGCYDNCDVWLIKTDSQGIIEWEQTFGGSYNDEGYSVQQTEDGGYIITGYTNSFGNGGSIDVWLIKTDPEGNTVPFGN